jgi:hypothetical protein
MVLRCYGLLRAAIIGIQLPAGPVLYGCLHETSELGTLIQNIWITVPKHLGQTGVDCKTSIMRRGNGGCQYTTRFGGLLVSCFLCLGVLSNVSGRHFQQLSWVPHLLQ